jgi:hypothetical protein
MIRYLKYSSVLLLVLVASCTKKHLITDDEYLAGTITKFNERKMLAANRSAQLFSVLSDSLTSEQKEAMQFLYAYMPLSDLADYDGRFFLANADKALQARSDAPWRKDIPEDVFLHYVLPCRVNNENLDSFRIIYFDEIHNRIKGMDLPDAALEINYWSHEKVAYQPADIRTSAPISTILSARGRCGEESTFTVAALRTAGIPARQVYTPRWAHVDDNHAWVEVWIKGNWYYFGACEPEPVLDRGWFTEPARRAMLVNTKSFGATYGKENVINNNRNFAEINNLSKYASTKKLFVKVSDSNGLPVSNASVEYQLYNYAEFYPLAIIPTDKNGFSSFETGFGDLIIWAYKGDDFAFRKISTVQTDTLNLTLDNNVPDRISLDLSVPPVLPPLPGPSAELSNRNSERISKGNRIRQNYIDSWIKHADVIRFADSLSLDTSRVTKIFSRAMGNFAEIRKLLMLVPDSSRGTAVALLEILPDKDLRDTKAYILLDHLVNSVKTAGSGKISESIYLNYVLNPRIANEMLISWRQLLRHSISSDSAELARMDPEFIVRWTNRNIRIDDNENYYGTPITPRGVSELRVSDKLSRSIFFVALCRSIGIPSRIEPARVVPQYYNGSKWIDVYFKDQQVPSASMSFLKLETNKITPEPRYFTNFTLARFQNGKYHTLEYEYDKKASDFKDELEVVPGKYMLVTGNRLKDWRILSELMFFEIKENEHKKLLINIRRDSLKMPVSQGKIDMAKITALFSDNSRIKSTSMEKGIVVAWIEPDQEPTKHIFNDLPKLKSDLDKWGGYFLFLTSTKLSAETFRSGDIKGLPEKSLFGTDIRMEAFKGSVTMDKNDDIRLPFIVVADKDGNITFTSTGYNIGIGDQILEYLNSR